ncbi:hypothetical protein R1sor_002888 [Riccia sorocarpa]|uniref:Exocyst subunit Exo70 family protein n=1 Tax=Riccia sorocarpa TaxID=122646 RepID=A0ABD3H478_9MARC
MKVSFVDRESVRERAVELDSSGRGGLAIRLVHREGANLLASRATFKGIVEKTKEVELALSRSTIRLQNMAESLPALQVVLKPLQAQTLVMNGIGSKIDRATEPGQKVLQAFEIVKNLERILIGEPRRDFWGYIASMTQLEEATKTLSHGCEPAFQWLKETVSFLAQSKIADNYRVYRLNDRIDKAFQDIKAEEGSCFDMGLLQISLENLKKEFQRILVDYSVPASLPQEMPDERSELDQVSMPPGFPLAAADMLQAIVEKLDHHKATDSLLEIYEESRRVAIKDVLKKLGANVYWYYPSHKELEKLPADKVHGEMVASWSQHVEVVCKILFKGEYNLCSRVFSKIEKAKWISCWGNLGSAGFVPFLVFGEAVASSRVAPENYSTLPYMYDVMDRCNDTILELFEGGGSACEEILLHAREVQKKLVAKASKNMSKFIQMVAKGEHLCDGELPPQGTRSLLCSYVMNYAGYLARSDGPTLSKMMRIQKKTETGVESEEDFFATAVHQMVEALEKRLIEGSTTYSHKSLGSIFLMNNYRYMISHVEEEDSGLRHVMGDQWHRDMLVKLRQQMKHYQRDTWVTMLEFLKRDGVQVSSSKGASRELARQRLRIFTQAFDEICEKHANWQVASEDLRADVEVAVGQMLIPAYTNFFQTFKGLLEQGSTKHCKYTPEDIEKKIEALTKELASKNLDVHSAHGSCLQADSSPFSDVNIKAMAHKGFGGDCGVGAEENMQRYAEHIN